MKTDLLFIYGTLLPQTGHPMAKWLMECSSEVGEGYISGNLFIIDNAYPGAIYNEGTADKVYGLIVRLNDPDSIIPVIDTYEEAGDMHAKPNEYSREIKQVYDNNGNLYLCWIYLYNREYQEYLLIKGGDFLTYIRNNNIL